MKTVFSPRILQCMRFRHNSRADAPLRIVMDYEFDFCIGCDRDLWIDEKKYKIEKGCFVIRKPGQRVRTLGIYDCYMLTLDFSDRTTPLSYSRNIATEKQKPFESDIWDVFPSVFKPLHAEDYIRIFEMLLAINDSDINANESSGLLVNELFHLLLADAFYLRLSQRDSEPTPIDRVCSYIKEHYAEQISLDDLAEIVHFNKNHLVRQFKKTVGVSPISYLIRLRMEHARKLLTETDFPVKEIAASCGYFDFSFFNSYFKKHHSLTPLEYRKIKRVND